MVGYGVATVRGDGNSRAQSVQAAMAELLKAHEYAAETQRSAWDFSLRIRELEALSLTANDFRWLICKQLVEHAREITLPADAGRSFRPESGLTFSRRTCFILSAEGVGYARQALATAIASEIPHVPPHGISPEQPHPAMALPIPHCVLTGTLTVASCVWTARW